jgi:nitrite reductase/ring-hydroxylating ferredoxin subunit
MIVSLLLTITHKRGIGQGQADAVAAARYLGLAFSPFVRLIHQTGTFEIMSKHVVATVAEIPPGQRKLVTIRGRQIAVFNLEGEFFGLFNRCPHQGGPMCEGILTGLIESSAPGEYRYSRKGEILRCPWHGWEFDIRTGQSFCDPAKINLRSYPVEVADGQRVAQGPYAAETIPVRVEEQYVVVDL